MQETKEYSRHEQQSLLDRLNALKDRFIAGDAFEEQVMVIESERKKFKRACMTLDIRKNPAFAVFVRHARDGIDACNQLLTEDESLSELDRKVLFARKRDYQSFLSHFDQAAADIAATSAFLDEQEPNSPDE